MENNQEEQTPVRCKTLIIGNSGVGKTSIISRYVNKFNQNIKSTIGASFTNKHVTIDGKKIIFEIWDTAGEERFRSINSIFYQDASICILVYDITDVKSFQDIKDFWYNSVLENSTVNIIFHVVGNKIDLFDKEKVDRNEVKDFCEKIGADSSFISAYDENSDLIDILFKTLGEKFVKSSFFKENDESMNYKSLVLKKPNKNKNNKNNNTNNKKKCCN